MSKLLIHLMTFDRVKTKFFREEIPLLTELYEKFWVNNIVFYLWNEKLEPDFINPLKNKWIIFSGYLNEEDLIKKVLELNKKYKSISITTVWEVLVEITNKLRKSLWQKISSNPEMFWDKSIQRELLSKNDPNISVKFIKNSINSLNFDIIKKQIWLPFVLKPSSWAHSAWVVKIYNSKDFDDYINNYIIFHEKIVEKWFNNSDTIIAEEYVDWKFFSIDYLVNENWKIIRSNPVRVTLWIDLWIEDFFNCSRIISNEVENEIDFLKLDDFISRNVKATWIRNTFMHHEFKINSKGEYKTIELNWRVWWNRLPLYKLWYDINLYSFIYENHKTNSLYDNIIFIRVYSHKNWILEWFNEELFSKIQDLESTFIIDKKKKIIWNKVWLTKYWFEHIVTIRLKNRNINILKQDYKFIIDNYKDLLIVKED